MKFYHAFKLHLVTFHKSIFGKNSKAGMSLVEIIIVLGLLGTVFLFMFNKLGQKGERAEKQATVIIMRDMAQTITDYKHDVGSYPKELKALTEKPQGAHGWMGPYTKENFVDAWKEEIIYRLEAGGEKFTLISKGPSKKLGTKDDLTRVYPKN